MQVGYHRPQRHSQLRLCKVGMQALASHPPCQRLLRAHFRSRKRQVPVLASSGFQQQTDHPRRASATGKLCGAAAAAAVLLSGGLAQASSEKVAEWSASGIIFRDSVELLSVPDQEVEGVTIYITDFKRSITEKLAREFFNEPSQASVTCAITGPVRIKDLDAIRGGNGREIFAERKNIFNLLQNKTLRVRRVYDEKNNTLIYVAYSTRFTSATEEGISTGRYKTSVCALPLSNAPTLAAQQPAAADSQ